jgi:hypothetical protein
VGSPGRRFSLCNAPGALGDLGYDMDTGDSGLRPYDLGCLSDLATPVQVLPCRHCAAWYVEIYRTDGGDLALREWHAVRCQHLQALLRDDEVSP